MSKETTQRKVVQKLINKWISEEWMAGRTYELIGGTIKACVCPEDDDKNNASNVTDLNSLGQKFIDTATDELYDHMESIVEFAHKYQYTFPSSYGEFKKYADELDVEFFEQFNGIENIETTKKLADVIGESIVSETRAVKSYIDGMAELDKLRTDPTDKDFQVNLYYGSDEISELMKIAKNNLFDENEHLETFRFELSLIDSAFKHGNKVTNAK